MERYILLFGFRAVKPFSMARLKIGTGKTIHDFGPQRFVCYGGTPSDSMADDDEKNQHSVTITQPFWVGDSPVADALSLCIG